VNTLYYGDNLTIPRNEIKAESVDLIYLDPPFNSKATYNVLFRSPKGHDAAAQIEAFEDTWHWGEQAEREFTELVQQPNTDVSEMMQALRRFLGENDMMAYLTMIANRLLELHRVLKETGSLYLHCDPTASHYLKIVLDGVFGKERFRNEIIWQRSTAHNMKTRGYVRANDTIFYYTKNDSFTFNERYTEYSAEQMSRYKPDENGRLYKAENLTFSNPNPHRQFEWRGSKPPPNRSWGASLEQLEKWYKEGRILLKRDGTPRLDGLKIYLDETKGTPLTSNWTDIERIGNTSGERLGYQTQKPLALLERIIDVSSDEDDIVLDPFCGCGTTVHAAQKLKRRWIGIDITHLAISLVEKRLRDAFPGITFEVHGTPKDLEGAQDLARRDKYQFQWWACSLINAQPYKGKRKGADTGIDGLIYFQDDKTMPKKIIVSVKGGESVSVPMIRDLGHVIDREKASLGLLVTLTPPTDPMMKEAIKTGYYDSPAGASFPKIQILTIEGLLNGTEQANYPDLMRGGLMFKKAKKEMTDEQLVLPSDEA
jgi:site-specific DNA-methyltransferase (adenine-specific)